MDVKLIDILVQELPKLGGWPDGVMKISQDYDGEIWCWRGHDYGTVKSYGRISEIADNHRKQGKDENRDCFVTREQYEAALAASKPEWDGVGLPPVGCECEWQDKNTKAWLPVVIAYSSEWVTVVRELRPLKVGDAVECCINNFGEEERLQFRPIRSEADKKKDEAVEALLAAYFNAPPYDEPSEDDRFGMYEVYSAIAAGKIPHLKIV